MPVHDSVYHFPDPAIRRDPILARAPGNQLFQFFCSWRPRNSGRYLLPSIGIFALSIVPFVLWKTTGNSRATLFGNLLFQCGMITYFTLAWRRRKAALREERTGLGVGSVSQLIAGPLGINRTALIDLWMCGVRGSDIAEAMYLEQRRMDLRVNFAVVLAIFAVISFPILHRSGGDQLSDYLLPAGLMLCGYSLGRGVQFGNTSNAIGMLKRIGLSIEAEFPERTATRRFLIYTFWWIAIPGAVIALIILFVIANHGYGKQIVRALFTRIDPSEPDVIIIRIVTALLMAGIAAAIALFNRRIRPFHESTLRDTLACFDHAFDRFVRVRLLNQEEHRR